jgi:hypothetical protein
MTAKKRAKKAARPKSDRTKAREASEALRVLTLDLAYEKGQLVRDGLKVLDEMEQLLKGTRFCLEKSGAFPISVVEFANKGRTIVSLATAFAVLSKVENDAKKRER